MIGPVLRLAAASATGRALRNAATEVSARMMLTLAAAVAGGVGLLCFSAAALFMMERTLDPAEAWAVLGGVYSVAGIGLYLTATRRRR